MQFFNEAAYAKHMEDSVRALFEKEAKAKAKAERQEKMLQEKMAQAKATPPENPAEKKEAQSEPVAAGAVPNSGS